MAVEPSRNVVIICSEVEDGEMRTSEEANFIVNVNIILKVI